MTKIKKHPLPYGINQISANWFAFHLPGRVFFGVSKQQVVDKEIAHRRERLSPNSEKPKPGDFHHLPLAMRKIASEEQAAALAFSSSKHSDRRFNA